MFVLCMREEYTGKRKAFRQVIDIHKVELEKKEKYWNEMLMVNFFTCAFHIINNSVCP